MFHSTILKCIHLGDWKSSFIMRLQSRSNEVEKSFLCLSWWWADVLLNKCSLYDKQNRLQFSILVTSTPMSQIDLGEKAICTLSKTTQLANWSPRKNILQLLEMTSVELWTKIKAFFDDLAWIFNKSDYD